jgi:hypothetical protein
MLIEQKTEVEAPPRGMPTTIISFFGSERGKIRSPQRNHTDLTDYFFAS